MHYIIRLKTMQLLFVMNHMFLMVLIKCNSEVDWQGWK